MTQGWVVAAAASALLYLACCALGEAAVALCARQAGVARYAWSSSVMEVCAGAVMQPRLQIGVGWQSPVMNRTPPAVVFSPQAMCVGFPAWPPPLPTRGEYMFPP